MKQFIDYGFGGTYLRILEEGLVAVNDSFSLLDRPKSTLTVAQLFELAFSKNKNQYLVRIAAESTAIALDKRSYFKRYLE